MCVVTDLRHEQVLCGTTHEAMRLSTVSVCFAESYRFLHVPENKASAISRKVFLSIPLF